MFILKVRVEESIKLLEVILSKLAKLNHSKNTSKTDKVHKSHKSPNDEFVCDSDDKDIQKSLKELILMLIGLISNGQDGKNEFDEYVGKLKEQLLEVVQGDLGSKLCDKNFSSYLEDCLGGLLQYCIEKKKQEENGAWKEAANALANVVAAHPMTRISKLLKIASNSNYPSEIRLAAASMVNDALSHMKGQSIDNASAKTLVALLGSTPDNVRDLVFSALKDAKKIEENSVSNRAVPPGNGVHGFLRRSLTLA